MRAARRPAEDSRLRPGAHRRRRGRRAAPRMTQPGAADRHAGLHGARTDQRRCRSTRAPTSSRSACCCTNTRAARIRLRRRPRWRTVARVLESDARPLAGRVPDVPSRRRRRDRALPAEGAGRSLRIGGRARSARSTRRDATRTAAASARRPGGASIRSSIALLYVVAATLAWQIKEWVETPVTVAIFLALGAAATIGGVLRGHLVFTERMNRARLTTERRRTRRAPRGCSIWLTAVLLFADAAHRCRHVGALPAVFALALASASPSRRSCSNRRRPPPRLERNS